MQKEEYWRRREEEERWRMEMRYGYINDLYGDSSKVSWTWRQTVVYISSRYEEDMYWRRMEEEQHHWDDRRRMPDGGYPQGPPGPPGLLGVRPGMPGLQPQGPVVGLFDDAKCSLTQEVAVTIRLLSLHILPGDISRSLCVAP